MLLEWWLRPRESCLNGRIQFRVENCYKLSRRMYSSRQTWFGTYLWKLVIFRMVKLFSLIWKWIVQVLVLVDEKNVVDCFWFSLMGWWSQLGICTFFWMRNIWMSQQLLRNNPPKMTHFIFLSFFLRFFEIFWDWKGNTCNYDNCIIWYNSDNDQATSEQLQYWWQHQ